MELLINDTSSTGNFTIFRSLRLLRIFRLIRPMRQQITVMLRTTTSVMTFFALLFLFMFTSAILGMHIFGGKFVFKDKFGQMTLSRSNFDTFVWAIVTVFQVYENEITFFYFLYKYVNFSLNIQGIQVKKFSWKTFLSNLISFYFFEQS